MSAHSDEPARLFVYGTLQPGGRWWHVVEPYVISGVEASAAGALYVRADGYPAAVFDDDDAGTVHGAVLDLLASQLEAAFAELDDFEGEEYVRIVVTTSVGHAWAYHSLIPPEPDAHIADGRYREPQSHD